MKPIHPKILDVSLSVALVTRNRPRSLERTLRSLRDQDIQPSEVIVSDDSDYANIPSVREIAEGFGCDYKPGPRRGLYANRNQAACACHGSHVRSMDDDHEFPARHIAACIEAISSDPNALWMIGERQPIDGPLGPEYVPGQLTASGFSVPPKQLDKCWAIADGAAIYPRQVFDRGLRFCEDFNFGAAYLEFGSRLHWLGYRSRILSSTYIVHHFDPATRSSLDQRTQISSRVFAALCHAYLYEPTMSNKVICVTQLLKYVLTRGGLGMEAVSAGIGAYARHRRRLVPPLYAI